MRQTYFSSNILKCLALCFFFKKYTIEIENIYTHQNTIQGYISNEKRFERLLMNEKYQ